MTQPAHAEIIRSWKEGRKLYHEAACERCGELFVFHASRPRKTCSRKCLVETIKAKTPRGRPIVRHTHTCPICGKSITLRGHERATRRLVTCGAEKCTSELRSRQSAHLTSRFPEWDEARRAAVSASPLAGPFATNASAKPYRLISPDGQCFEGRNLALFVRDHAELFDEDDLAENSAFGPRAYTSLARLDPARKHHRTAWKGWRWWS